MLYFRAIARAAAAIVVFCLGLWGLQVTFDLQALLVVAAIVGLVNFGLALHDERSIKEARRQAGEDRQILRDLQRHVQSSARFADIPAHLQDLSRMSNTQLKALVETTSRRLRDFDAELTANRDTTPYWRRFAGWSEASEEQRSEWWNQDNERSRRENDREKSEFLKHYRPDAQALWEEMRRRLGGEDLGDFGRSVAIQYGVFAGPNPVEEAAEMLDALARRLEDD